MKQIVMVQKSSLEKVFGSQTGLQADCPRGGCLRGEEFGYQLVLRLEEFLFRQPFRISVESPLGDAVSLFTVDTVPCEFTAYPNMHDEHYLSLEPGLFPDLLTPLTEDTLELSPYLNTVVWVNISVPRDCPAGEYPVKVVVEGRDRQAESTFTLKVIPAELPKQKLLCTQWFYADCLADRYGVEIYSPAHWKLLEEYLRLAAARGMNMVLTPALTPALNTAVGHERPCTQLLEIEKDGECYRFDFGRLRRFMEMARACGIENFEFSHLFSQWGARFAPNIYVAEQGERKRVFGWDTPADSPAYRGFLDQLLPQLTAFLKEMGALGHAVFHISDEPGEKDLESYRTAREMVAGHLREFPIIDALSDVKFYDMGLVETPVATTDHIEPFLERKVPGLWTYYCCAQSREVANRFLSMPSYRNRIIGLQLYKFGLTGFLHWGYNFWYTWDSRKQVDPFRFGDAGGMFPGGDSFLVYPGEDGPLESLRLKVFHHAMQDVQALELLESLAGREEALRVIDADNTLTFRNYPHSAQALLDARERVNAALAALV